MMKKSILHIGKALNRAEQKQINGGDSGGSGDFLPGKSCDGNNGTSDPGCPCSHNSECLSSVCHFDGIESYCL